MEVTFQKVQCWTPGTAFNVFLERTQPIDIAALAESTRKQTIQVGPYQIELSIVGKGIDGLRVGSKGVALSTIGDTRALSGSVFVFLPEGVTSSFDGVGALGSASGCFEIHW